MERSKAKKTSKALFNRAIFIFRRDHRLEDNTGLLETLKISKEVFPCFVFDSRQIKPDQNEYFSNKSVQFMCQSLCDLDQQIKSKNSGSKLNFFYGTYPGILGEMLEAIKPDLLSFNMDYTPYAKERDDLIKKICEEKKIETKIYEDCCLLNIKQALAGRDQFYKVYTPFYRKVGDTKIPRPKSCDFVNFSEEKIKTKNSIENLNQFYKEEPEALITGGRATGLKILEDFPRLKDYEKIRNDPNLNTSLLSAHNKFGTVSIREVYYAAKRDLGAAAERFIRQLYWRDFYYYIGYFYGQVFGGPMYPKYAYIDWNTSEEDFEAWKEGRTGVPIVDASMRNLNKKGYMPNRCRMIVGSFLVKLLHIDWLKGEKYFATKLIDYDPCQNNGGWQWCSGSGCDSQPYFRVFKMENQSKKFDPKASYIKKWVPELKKVPASDIHTWEQSYQDFKVDYPKPIVEHAKERLASIDEYKEAFERYEKAIKVGEVKPSATVQPKRAPNKTGGKRLKRGRVKDGTDVKTLDKYWAKQEIGNFWAEKKKGVEDDK